MENINMDPSQASEASSGELPQQAPNQATFEDLWSSALDDSPTASPTSSPVHNNNYHNNSHNQRRKKKFKKIRLPGGPIMSDSDLNQMEKLMLDRAIRESLRRGSRSNSRTHIRNHQNNDASYSRSSRPGCSRSRRPTAPATSPIPKSEQSINDNCQSLPTSAPTSEQSSNAGSQSKVNPVTNMGQTTSNGCQISPTPKVKPATENGSYPPQTIISQEKEGNQMTEVVTPSAASAALPPTSIHLQPQASSMTAIKTAKQSPQIPHSNTPNIPQPASNPDQSSPQKLSSPRMTTTVPKQDQSVPTFTLPPGFEYMSESQQQLFYEYQQQQMRKQHKQAISTATDPSKEMGDQAVQSQCSKHLQQEPSKQQPSMTQATQPQSSNNLQQQPSATQAVQPKSSNIKNQQIPHQAQVRPNDAATQSNIQPIKSQFEAQNNSHRQSCLKSGDQQEQSHMLSKEKPMHGVQPESSQFHDQSSAKQPQAVKPQSSNFVGQKHPQPVSQIEQHQDPMTKALQPQSANFVASESQQRQVEPSSVQMTQAAQPQSSNFRAQRNLPQPIATSNVGRTQAMQPESLSFGVQRQSGPQQHIAPSSVSMAQAIQPESSQFRNQRNTLPQTAHVEPMSVTQVAQPQTLNLTTQRRSHPHASHANPQFATRTVQPQSSQFGLKQTCLQPHSENRFVSSQEASGIHMTRAQEVSQTQMTEPQSANLGPSYQSKNPQPQYSQQQHILNQQQRVPNQNIIGQSQSPHKPSHSQGESPQKCSTVEKRKPEDQGEETVAVKRQKHEEQKAIESSETKEEDTPQSAVYNVGGENNLVVHRPEGCTFNIYQNKSEHSESGDRNYKGCCNGSCNANNGGSPKKAGSSKQHAIEWAGATTETDSGQERNGTGSNIPIFMFREMAQSIGRKWKSLARQLPMVEYSLLESELKILDGCNGNDMEKSLAVLTKWWRENPDNWDAPKMKCQLEDALRDCHLVRLARNIDEAFKSLSV